MYVRNKQGGENMTDIAKTNIKDTVRILMQLDKQSLLLIDSGARLLAARQDMDKETSEDARQLQTVT